MSSEPYAGAAQVFRIVDNGPSHRGPHAVIRMRATWPTAQLVHLPVHANWLNQMGIHFSIVQRKVIKPQDFADLEDLAERLLTFQVRCNATAEPFDWHFGRTFLDRLRQRLAARQTPSRMTPDDSTESSTRTRSPSRPITWSIGEGCAGRPKASTGWGPHPADRARAAGHQRGSRPSAGGGTGALPLCPAGDRRGMRSRSAA